MKMNLYLWVFFCLWYWPLYGAETYQLTQASKPDSLTC
jgi:hypothetical protein